MNVSRAVREDVLGAHPVQAVDQAVRDPSRVKPVLQRSVAVVVHGLLLTRVPGRDS